MMRSLEPKEPTLFAYHVNLERRVPADHALRQVKMERSFADAANNHGSKRARWPRQWRQQIQSWLIAAIQNLRLLINQGGKGGRRATAALLQIQNQDAVTDSKPTRSRIATVACSITQSNRCGSRTDIALVCDG